MTSAVKVGTVPQWTIADRFRKAREHAALSQIELAQAMEVGRSTIARIEQGAAVPKRPIVLAWAFATGVDLDWLLQGDAGPDGCPQQGSNLRPADYKSGDSTALTELAPVAVLPFRHAA